MSDPVLSVRGLGVEFSSRAEHGAGPRPAVHDLSFDIAPGEVLALVGESGSGKSVTAMSLLGLLPSAAHVRGSARLGATELLGAPPSVLRSVRGRRIGAVFQEPMAAFNPVMRLGAQLVEAIRAHPRSRPAGGRAGARAEALRLLERVGLDQPERAFTSYPHQLSGGQLQRVMIAMAISGSPELLIADEPTTALDVTVQAGILELLHELRTPPAGGSGTGRGTAILLITHDMGVVADLADRVVVLRDGEEQETGNVEPIFTAPASDYTRTLLAAVPRIDGGKARPPAADNAPAASVENVTITYGRRHRLTAVDSVSLEVRAGATLGLVGESGSGKSTLGKALAGLIPLTAGSVTVAGADLSGLSAPALRRARSRIGFVFQSPVDSLNPRARVGDSIAEPLRLHTDLAPAQRSARVRDWLDRVRLPAGAAGRYPHELSGGQRQRVAIARALVLDPGLLIADEPTSALDVSVQATVLDLIADLQNDLGFGCLFISHDLAVVRQIADHVAVMQAGRIVETGPTDRVLTSPREAYTQRLLDSVLVPDPRLRQARHVRR